MVLLEENAGQHSAAVHINPLVQEDLFPVVRPRGVQHFPVDPPNCVWAIDAVESTFHATQLSGSDV